MSTGELKNKIKELNELADKLAEKGRIFEKEGRTRRAIETSENLERVEFRIECLELKL